VPEIHLRHRHEGTLLKAAARVHCGGGFLLGRFFRSRVGDVDDSPIEKVLKYAFWVLSDGV